MQCFDDQAKIADTLATQKAMAQMYNQYAGECSTKTRRNKLLDILNEQHEMQFDVFSAMEKRGWYTPRPPRPKSSSRPASSLPRQKNSCKFSHTKSAFPLLFAQERGRRFAFAGKITAASIWQPCTDRRSPK